MTHEYLLKLNMHLFTIISVEKNIKCDLRGKNLPPFYFHPYKSPNLNIEQNAERESLQSSSFCRVYKEHVKCTRQGLLCRRQAKDYLLVGCIRPEKSKTTQTLDQTGFHGVGGGKAADKNI